MPSRKNFTDRTVAAARPKAARYERWEPSGLGLRITPKGKKSWVWLFRVEGKNRRVTFGSYPTMGLAAARTALAKAKEAVSKGGDPGKQLVKSRRTERRAQTVSELVEDYLDLYARKRKRSAIQDERMLHLDVVPRWGRRKVHQVSRADVVDLLDSIVDRGAPISANRTFSVIRRMFRWAQSRDVVSQNPCEGVERPAAENRRDRTLSDEEIRAFWRGLDSANMTGGVRLVLRLLLLTGQRSGEVCGMALPELDIPSATWIIPADRAKNARAHVVPLSRQAIDLLRKPVKRAGEGPWIFPSVGASGHITTLGVASSLRVNRESLGVPDLRPHDLRRSCATGMSAQGVSRLVVGRILNHVDGSITARYDRHEYLTERRDALERWAAHVSKVIEYEPATGEKVVRLRG